MLFLETQSFPKFEKTSFYLDIVNIFLVLFYFCLLPKFSCNIMTTKDVNLCANLNKKPKPTKN